MGESTKKVRRGKSPRKAEDKSRKKVAPVHQSPFDCFKRREKLNSTFFFGGTWKIAAKDDVGDESVLHLVAPTANAVLGVLDAVRALLRRKLLSHLIYHNVKIIECTEGVDNLPRAREIKQ